MHLKWKSSWCLLAAIAIAILPFTPTLHAGCDYYFVGCDVIPGYEGQFCEYPGPWGEFILYETETGPPEIVPEYHQSACVFCVYGCSKCTYYEMNVWYYDCDWELVNIVVPVCCNEIFCCN